MKKLLTIAVAALMLASCNAKADKATSNALNDSVSEAMGKLYGSGISSSLKTGPDSAKFNADEFLKGVDYALSVDTAELANSVVWNWVSTCARCKSRSKNARM